MEGEIEYLLDSLQFVSIRKENIVILNRTPAKRSALERFPWRIFEDINDKRRVEHHLREVCDNYNTPYILKLSKIGPLTRDKRYVPNYHFFNHLFPSLEELNSDVKHYIDMTRAYTFEEVIIKDFQFYEEELKKVFDNQIEELNTAGAVFNISFNDIDIDDIKCQIPRKRREDCYLKVNFDCQEEKEDCPFKWELKNRTELCTRQEIWKEVFLHILNKFDEVIKIIKNEVIRILPRRRKCGIMIPYNEIEINISDAQ